MASVTVSPESQVVIPKEIREKLGMLPGLRIQVVVHGDRIERMPVRPVKRMRGFLQGIYTRVLREEDRA